MYEIVPKQPEKPKYHSVLVKITQKGEKNLHFTS